MPPGADVMVPAWLAWGLKPNRGEECCHLPSKITEELGCGVEAELAKGSVWGGGRGSQRVVV